jgi:hypothetical protein
VEYVKNKGRVLAGFIVEYRDLMSVDDETKQLREKVDNYHTNPSPLEQSKDQFNLYEEFDAHDNDGW